MSDLFNPIGTVVLLGLLLVGMVALAVFYFGPLPPRSPKRIAAGAITLLGVVIIILTQTWIEARFRAESSFHRTANFASPAIMAEGLIGISLILYATYGKRR